MIFFLPFLHEKLNDSFANRINKKPKKFGGEIDLLIDNIPIELKVRRNISPPLSEVINDAYRPASQASAYAATTRLAFVCVLDLPGEAPQQSNLDSAVSVIEKVIDNGFPTCVVVFMFHCHHPMPSATK